MDVTLSTRTSHRDAGQIVPFTRRHLAAEFKVYVYMDEFDHDSFESSVLVKA